MSAPALPVTDVRRPRKVEAAQPLTVLAVLDRTMQTLASLKLTVVLFSLGIFVILVGTLAQTEADIWQVVRDYFHAWIMWVDINVLLPKSFFPGMPHIPLPAIPFFGGMSVGTLMIINLLAAHGWRFKIQADGARLASGVLVILAGVLTAVVIIWAGHNSQGFQAKPPFEWDAFWKVFLLGSGLVWLAGVVSYGYYGLARLFQGRVVPWIEIVVLVLIGLPLAAVAGLLAWGLMLSYRPSDEALRIVWQLMQGSLAGMVLLVGCILVFRKRGGMVLLHLGIGLLFFNELWVAQTARERQVFMLEGQSANYLRDIRTTELAIVDRSGEETDEHIVIPRDKLIANAEANARLQKQGRPLEYIEHNYLPVKVAVLEYYRNADVESLKPGQETPATTGRGLKEALVPLSVAKGTDTGGGVDLAGAYVQFADKEGNDLGTFLLSQLAAEQKFPERFAEKLQVGDQTYHLFLRFKHEYKPYTLTLIDVRKDDYVASDTPRNYSSDVRIVDSEAGVDQVVHIKMNDPLRYRGDTFYQSGYHLLQDGEATTLQVVHNRGWMIPYVACMVVVIGMLAHFLITVTRFVSRRENEEVSRGEVMLAELAPEDYRPAPARGKGAAVAAVPDKGGFNWSMVGLPLLAVGIFVLFVGRAARPPQSPAGGFDIVRFGELPVAHHGRVKPIDTLARTSVRTLTINSESARSQDGDKIPAAQWLLEVIARPEEADKLPVIRIDSAEVRRIFNLETRKGFMYSIEELRPKMDDFVQQANAAKKVPAEDLTTEQRRIIELAERLQHYISLVHAFSPPRLPRVPTQEQIAADPSAAPSYMRSLGMAIMQSKEEMKQMKAPRPIPLKPEGDEEEVTPDDAWHAYPDAWARAYLQHQFLGQQPDPATIAFEELIAAYRDGDPKAFNTALDDYETHLHETAPPLWEQKKIRLESWFNHFSPFYTGMPLYVIAFLMATCGWLVRYKPLNWGAFTLLVLAFLLHTGALALRIYISGRPPVTNLYSSAVFIGWGAVLLGLIVEAIYRVGLGNIVASAMGFATLVIAYLLAAGGDTITVLQAVLDTQFWLATHVVIITKGYVATYVAGLLGLLYVVFGQATPMLSESSRKDLGRMIYGVVCFALLLSFYGTVLGGLWADDSWGRFWGWDPKENGALIIVLWNALILHARWDKMVGDRGLAVLAIGGNIVTTWSWFGVNELGIGLHSYGFTDGVLLAMGIVIGYMLLMIGMGSIPMQHWWSTAGGRLRSAVPLVLCGVTLGINALFFLTVGALMYRYLA